MGKWWKRWRKEQPPERRGTFVMEADWLRSEELRPDRLGPTDDDVRDPERVRVERWRPGKSLGPL